MSKRSRYDDAAETSGHEKELDYRVTFCAAQCFTGRANFGEVSTYNNRFSRPETLPSLDAAGMLIAIKSSSTPFPSRPVSFLLDHHFTGRLSRV